MYNNKEVILLILIGESINSSIPTIKKCIEEENFDKIGDIAREQEEKGASYIDINAGAFIGDEPKILQKLVMAAIPKTNLPFFIDSANPEAVAAAISVCDGRKIVLNSVSLEKSRLEGILPLAAKHKTGIVALSIDDKGIPEDPFERLEIAKELVSKANGLGIKSQDIFVDAVVTPVSVNHLGGVSALDFIKLVKNEIEDVKTCCGLSNISFGLPSRKNLNRAFILMAYAYGLDSAIADVLDKRQMSLIYSARAILGNDEYCGDYLSAYRSGHLE